jgi:hypothetical protein
MTVQPVRSFSSVSTRSQAEPAPVASAASRSCRLTSDQAAGKEGIENELVSDDQTCALEKLSEKRFLT